MSDVEQNDHIRMIVVEANAASCLYCRMPMGLASYY